jgi:tetratricopeptide (TPR) repeat protein
MEKRNLWISLVAVVLSFAGGFFLANAINRSELNTLRSENERLKTAPADVQNKGSDSELTSDEINAKLAEADQNPQNFDYQKQLGLALYKYGSMKQDPELVTNSIRLLERADSLRNTDHDVILGLGNAYFDIGYFKKENEYLEKARGLYERALKQYPTDADVKTDLALTYFLFDPPDDEKAIAGFKEALKINPKLERALEFIVQSLIRTNRKAEAAEYLAQLKRINPNNDAIGGLTSKLNESASNQPK